MAMILGRAATKHAPFDEAELKPLVTGKDTNGQFGFHLVRITPGKKICSPPLKHIARECRENYLEC